jgi:transcriptional regulator with XRE-family HTH domain
MESHVKSERLRAIPAGMLRDLIAARHAGGLSQRALAAKTGLPQVHISAIETGKVSPRIDTLLDLARVLGFDLMLVPRPLIPAVQSLIRDSKKSDAQESDEADRPLYATDGSDETS